MNTPSRIPTTLFIAAVLALQVAEATGVLGHMPVLPFHGNLDHLLNFAMAHGSAVAGWIRIGTEVLLCAFWATLLLASTPLAKGVPPPPSKGEVAYNFRQLRSSRAPEVALLILAHSVSLGLTLNGLWWLSIPIDLASAVGEALLVYVLLIPEGRIMVTLIYDTANQGTANRIIISGGRLSTRYGSLTVRHDHLRSVALFDPTWARLCNTAHVGFGFLDGAGRERQVLVRAVAKKEAAAWLYSELSGPHRNGRPLPWTLPPSFVMFPPPAGAGPTSH